MFFLFSLVLFLLWIALVDIFNDYKSLKKDFKIYKKLSKKQYNKLFSEYKVLLQKYNSIRDDVNFNYDCILDLKRNSGGKHYE